MSRNKSDGVKRSGEIRAQIVALAQKMYKPGEIINLEALKSALAQGRKRQRGIKLIPESWDRNIDVIVQDGFFLHDDDGTFSTYRLPGGDAQSTTQDGRNDNGQDSQLFVEFQEVLGTNRLHLLPTNKCLEPFLREGLSSKQSVLHFIHERQDDFVRVFVDLGCGICDHVRAYISELKSNDTPLLEACILVAIRIADAEETDLSAPDEAPPTEGAVGAGADISVDAEEGQCVSVEDIGVFALRISEGRPYLAVKGYVRRELETPTHDTIGWPEIIAYVGQNGGDVETALASAFEEGDDQKAFLGELDGRLGELREHVGPTHLVTLVPPAPPPSDDEGEADMSEPTQRAEDWRCIQDTASYEKLAKAMPNPEDMEAAVVKAGGDIGAALHKYGVKGGRFLTMVRTFLEKQGMEVLPPGSSKRRSQTRSRSTPQPDAPVLTPTPEKAKAKHPRGGAQPPKPIPKEIQGAQARVNWFFENRWCGRQLWEAGIRTAAKILAGVEELGDAEFLLFHHARRVNAVENLQEVLPDIRELAELQAEVEARAASASTEAELAGATDEPTAEVLVPVGRIGHARALLEASVAAFRRNDLPDISGDIRRKLELEAIKSPIRTLVSEFWIQLMSHVDPARLACKQAEEFNLLDALREDAETDEVTAIGLELIALGDRMQRTTEQADDIQGEEGGQEE